MYCIGKPAELTYVSLPVLIGLSNRIILLSSEVALSSNDGGCKLLCCNCLFILLALFRQYTDAAQHPYSQLAVLFRLPSMNTYNQPFHP